MINAGDYKHKIKIVELVKDEANSKGGFVVKKENAIIEKVRAKILQASGYTIFKQNSDFKEAHINFTIRYNSMPKRGHYIVFNGEYYRIDYVRDIENKHIELEMQAILVNKNG